MKYKLVPFEPTKKMQKAALSAPDDAFGVGIYKAMLEAAPAAPVGLEPVAYMASSGTFITAEGVSYTPNWTDYCTRPLVRQSDAAAVIAAKDAEIERLTQSKAEWKKVADENLKGMSMCREQLAAKDAEISELQQNVQTTADALGHAHLELAAMKGEEA